MTTESLLYAILYRPLLDQTGLRMEQNLTFRARMLRYARNK